MITRRLGGSACGRGSRRSWQRGCAMGVRSKRPGDDDDFLCDTFVNQIVFRINTCAVALRLCTACVPMHHRRDHEMRSDARLLVGHGLRRGACGESDALCALHDDARSVGGACTPRRPACDRSDHIVAHDTSATTDVAHPLRPSRGRL